MEHSLCPDKSKRARDADRETCRGNLLKRTEHNPVAKHKTTLLPVRYAVELTV